MRGPADLRTAVLETTWGDISIRASARGLCGCRLPKASARAIGIPFRVVRVRLPRRADDGLRRAADFARRMLEGREPGPCPARDPASWSGVPEFRRSVWRALRTLPRGRTATYGELARRAGNPRAARAAGSACGANPLPLFVPCHRAVAAAGRLGGFSSGLAWKRLLLSGEGARR